MLVLLPLPLPLLAKLFGVAGVESRDCGCCCCCVAFGMIILEYLKVKSMACIHFLPASIEGARKMIDEAGKPNISDTNASP